MSVLLFLLIIVILVIVHEYGHFTVAKLFGIRVDEFGIGYPPRAFDFGVWHGTRYTLNWIPFGGFVKIFGEEKSDSISKQERRQSFAYRSWYVKSFVLLAGVIGNVLFAWLLFTIAISSGAPITVEEGTELAKNAHVTVTSVVDQSPADMAGLKPGDIVIQIEDAKSEIPVSGPTMVTDFIQKHGGKSITLSLQRDGQMIEKTVIPAQGVLEAEASKAAIGISLGFIHKEKIPLISAIGPGLYETYMWFEKITISVFVLISQSVTGNADISSISGPIGIATHVSEWSELGLVYLLYFTAIISVNLAVINLIPIPALDGGRLVFVIIEAIRRKPISQNVTTIVNVLGFGLIILLMLAVSVNDVRNLF